MNKKLNSDLKELSFLLALILIISSVILVIQAPTTKAWGPHKFIEKKAENVFSDNSFFSNHHNTLYRWCTEPDSGWGERYWHWYHVDRSHEDTSEGTLPQALENIFNTTTSKLRRGNSERAAELLGAGAHFTQDATQPLHSTSDYSPGGRHGDYEGMAISQIDNISIPEYAPRKLDNIRTSAVDTLKESFDFTDEDPDGGVNLSDFLEEGTLWNATIQSITENRIRAGVQFTANYWYTAMIEAGLTIQSPTVKSPSDGSTLTENTPTFDWGSVSNVKTYDFQLALDNNFTSNVLTVKDLSNTSYASTGELSSGIWYWRVRSGDNSTHVGLWSDTHKFSLSNATKGGFTLSTPTNKKNGSPGSILNYTITISNTGSITDNYPITVQNTSGWNLSPKDNILKNVEPNEEKEITLTLSIPDNDKLVGKTGKVKVTASSQENTMLTDSTILTVEISKEQNEDMPDSIDGDRGEKQNDSEARLTVIAAISIALIAVIMIIFFIFWKKKEK